MLCRMCGVAPGTIHVNETDLVCEACHSEIGEAITRISDLIEQGHHPHCAKRIVYGDGECECKEYEKGYDPYSWIPKDES